MAGVGGGVLAASRGKGSGVRGGGREWQVLEEPGKDWGFCPKGYEGPGGGGGSDDTGSGKWDFCFREMTPVSA